MNAFQPNRLPWIPAVVVLVTFLIVGWLVWLMGKHTQPPSINAQRSKERLAALADVRAADAKALHGDYVWQDEAKRIVHLPIARAKELAIVEGRNPAQGRSNLLDRLEKATAAPPRAPEKPSEYE